MRAVLIWTTVQVDKPKTLQIKKLPPLQQNYCLEWARHFNWTHLVGNLEGSHRRPTHESQCAWAITTRKKWRVKEEKKGPNFWLYWAPSDHCGFLLNLGLPMHVVYVWVLGWGSLHLIAWNLDAPHNRSGLQFDLAFVLSSNYHPRTS